MLAEIESPQVAPTPEDLAAALEAGASALEAAVDEADLEPCAQELQADKECPDAPGLHQQLEALLFVATEALPIEKMVRLTRSSEERVTTVLAELEAEYETRGITVRLVAGGYRFATAPKVRTVVEEYLLPPKTSLSPAALETLAIVAYSQPITKAEIEAIRGVSVDGVVSSLVERGMIQELGRKDTVGKPMLFGTTAQFLEAFGLPSLADLPPLPDEQVERLSAETADPQALEGTLPDHANEKPSTYVEGVEDMIDAEIARSAGESEDPATEAAKVAEAQVAIEADTQAEIETEDQAAIDAEDQTAIDAEDQTAIDAEDQTAIDAEDQAAINAEDQAAIDAEDQTAINAEDQTAINAEAQTEIDPEVAVEAETLEELLA